MATHIKQCGHSECSLNTPRCCGCEDGRSIAASYANYRDGAGIFHDNSINARYRNYCPGCKRQLSAIGPGKKRCICGVVACDLATDRCCICLDTRPRGQVYYKYLDGHGMSQVNASRWMHYCPSCQDRIKPQPPKVSKVTVPLSMNASLASHAKAPLSAVSTRTQIPCGSMSALIKKARNAIDLSSSHADVGLPPSDVSDPSHEKAAQAEVEAVAHSPVAVEEYEIISYDEVFYNEKTALISGGDLKHNGASRCWRILFWKR